MSKRMIVLLVLAVVVFGGLIGVKVYFSKVTDEFLDNLPVSPETVTATEAKLDDWVSELTSVGTVVAVQGADLTTQESGIIEKIYFDSGDLVQSGDVILTLDTATDRADLKTLEAAQRLAELERDRVESLWQRKNVSKSEFDQRKSQLEQAEAQVAAQKARLEQKKLRAPYAGRLGIRQVNIGQYINAGDPMIGLQSLDSVFVDFTLPEQRYRDIQVGVDVRAQMDALGQETFQGTLSAIEPVIDTNTRNFKVRATFSNPKHRIRPGMFARVAINVGESREVVVVPRTAISFNPYGNSVFVLTETESKGANDKPMYSVKQRFVQTGETRGDLIVIDSGLEVGETVATTGLLKLRGSAAVFIDNTLKPDANIAPTPENG